MNINRDQDNPGYGCNINKVQKSHEFINKYGSCVTQCQGSTRELFRTYLNNINNGIFVEIGVWGGASLLYNYDLCNKNNIKIFGIDPFEKIHIFNGKKIEHSNKEVINISKNKAENRRKNLEDIINKNNLKINLLQKNSYDIVDIFDNNSIDLLHIDGDHSYEGVKKDLNLYWNKIKNGGIIINDDYSWGCCKRAIDEFVSTNKNNIKKSFSPFNNKHIIIKK